MNVQHLSLYRSASNPRLPPYSQTIVVSALSKIKQQFFGLSNLDFGTGKKSTNVVGVASKKFDGRGSKSSSSTSDGDKKHTISAVFGTARGWKTLNPTQKPGNFEN